MPFNNIYPVTYQQPFYQQQPMYSMQQQPQTQVQQTNGIVWVQGEAGAKAHYMNPGETAILMDSENPFFYIKTVNQAGVPFLEKYRFEKVVDTPQENHQEQQINFDQYITRDEFERRISEISSKNNNHRKQQPKKEVTSNA